MLNSAMTNPYYFLRLGLPVAVMMASATSAEGVLRALKNQVNFSGSSVSLSSFLVLIYTIQRLIHHIHISIFSSMW